MINKTDLEMLKARIEKLEEVKKDIATFKADYDKKIAPLNNQKKKVEEEIADLKLVIGEAATSHFKATGEKKQLGGVKIQETKAITLDYNSGDAIAFAKEKDMFLVLDKKAFESAAPNLNLDFVKVETLNGTKVTFPKVIKLED